MSKFTIVGIKEPGRVNVMLNGRFTDVNLFTAPDDVLEALYQDKNPHVKLTPDEFVKRNPELTAIKVEPIKVSRKRK